MRRSGEIKWGELRLGLFVFIALALFLWASIQGATGLFRKDYELHTRFGNVQGVVSGAPIWFQGVEVGTVKSLDFRREADSSVVNVRFTVSEDAWPMVRRDSHVRIQALNVFGEKFMEVTPGSVGSPRVEPGDTLLALEPPDLNELLSRAARSVERLDAIFADLQYTMGEVRRGRGTIGRLVGTDELYVELDLSVRRFRTLATRFDASQAEMRRAVVSLATTLDSLGRRVERGEGTLGRLTRDESLYEDLRSATSHADSVFGRIVRGEGNLGKLSRDEDLYRNLEQSLDRLNRLIADIQKDPKKYFKFSVF